MFRFREVMTLLQWKSKGKTEADQIKEFIQIWIVFSTDCSVVWKELKMKKISEKYVYCGVSLTLRTSV